MKKIIKIIMLLRGFTNATLAEKCGYTSPSGVSNVINREYSMKVENLLKFMDAMDCEVVIRSKLADKNEWVIK